MEHRLADSELSFQLVQVTEDEVETIRRQLIGAAGVR
jgi:hypothetical protein